MGGARAPDGRLFFAPCQARSVLCFNPATGEVQAQVALASADELAAAVDIAARAQPAWAAKNPQVRARVMQLRAFDCKLVVRFAAASVSGFHPWRLAAVMASTTLLTTGRKLRHYLSATTR